MRREPGNLMKGRILRCRSAYKVRRLNGSSFKSSASETIAQIPSRNVSSGRDGVGITVFMRAQSSNLNRPAP